MSYTFTLSGRSSILSAKYHPPINLDGGNEDKYVLGLISFESYNSIPNIEKDVNDKFYYGSEGKYIQIPEGAYEIDSVNEYLQRALAERGDLRNPVAVVIKGNNNTLRCRIKCTDIIDFSPKDSIGRWLGFKPRKLMPEIPHDADFPIDIFKVNTICIQCNIVGGSYLNNEHAHIVHEFFPAVPAGFKIIESPRNIVYLPINTQIIDEIIVKIVDQNGELINFKGEVVSLRLHLKKQEL